MSPDCSGNLAADHGLINKACERPADNGADRRYTRPLHPHPPASLRGRVRLPVTPHTRFGSLSRHTVHLFWVARQSSLYTRFGACPSSHYTRLWAVCRHTVHTFGAVCRHTVHPFVVCLSSHYTTVLRLSVVTVYTRLGACYSVHLFLSPSVVTLYTRFGGPVCRHTVHTFVVRLSSHCTPVWDPSACPQRPYGPLGPGRPPRLSHSSGSMLLYVHSK